MKPIKRSGEIFSMLTDKELKNVILSTKYHVTSREEALNLLITRKVNNAVDMATAPDAPKHGW